MTKVFLFSSTVDQEEAGMKSTVEVSCPRRPGLIHRNTDPYPMREFVRSRDWDWEGNKIQEKVEQNYVKINPPIYEESERESEHVQTKKNVFNEEGISVSKIFFVLRTDRT